MATNSKTYEEHLRYCNEALPPIFAQFLQFLHGNDPQLAREFLVQNCGIEHPPLVMILQALSRTWTLNWGTLYGGHLTSELLLSACKFFNVKEASPTSKASLIGLLRVLEDCFDVKTSLVVLRLQGESAGIGPILNQSTSATPPTPTMSPLIIPALVANNSSQTLIRFEDVPVLAANEPTIALDNISSNTGQEKLTKLLGLVSKTAKLKSFDKEKCSAIISLDRNDLSKVQSELTKFLKEVKMTVQDNLPLIVIYLPEERLTQEDVSLCIEMSDVPQGTLDGKLLMEKTNTYNSAVLFSKEEFPVLEGWERADYTAHRVQIPNCPIGKQDLTSLLRTTRGIVPTFIWRNEQTRVCVVHLSSAQAKEQLLTGPQLDFGTPPAPDIGPHLPSNISTTTTTAVTPTPLPESVVLPQLESLVASSGSTSTPPVSPGPLRSSNSSMSSSSEKLPPSKEQQANANPPVQTPERERYNGPLLNARFSQSASSLKPEVLVNYPTNAQHTGNGTLAAVLKKVVGEYQVGYITDISKFQKLVPFHSKEAMEKALRLGKISVLGTQVEIVPRQVATNVIELKSLACMEYIRAKRRPVIQCVCDQYNVQIPELAAENTEQIAVFHLVGSEQNVRLAKEELLEIFGHIRERSHLIDLDPQFVPCLHRLLDQATETRFADSYLTYISFKSGAYGNMTVRIQMVSMVPEQLDELAASVRFTPDSFSEALIPAPHEFYQSLDKKALESSTSSVILDYREKEKKLVVLGLAEEVQAIQQQFRSKLEGNRKKVEIVDCPEHIYYLSCNRGPLIEFAKNSDSYIQITVSNGTVSITGPTEAVVKIHSDCRAILGKLVKRPLPFELTPKLQQRFLHSSVCQQVIVSTQSCIYFARNNNQEAIKTIGIVVGIVQAQLDAAMKEFNQLVVATVKVEKEILMKCRQQLDSMGVQVYATTPYRIEGFQDDLDAANEVITHLREEIEETRTVEYIWHEFGFLVKRLKLNTAEGREAFKKAHSLKWIDKTGDDTKIKPFSFRLHGLRKCVEPAIEEIRKILDDQLQSTLQLSCTRDRHSLLLKAQPTLELNFKVVILVSGVVDEKVEIAIYGNTKSVNEEVRKKLEAINFTKETVAIDANDAHRLIQEAKVMQRELDVKIYVNRENNTVNVSGETEGVKNAIETIKGKATDTIQIPINDMVVKLHFTGPGGAEQLKAIEKRIGVSIKVMVGKAKNKENKGKEKEKEKENDIEGDAVLSVRGPNDALTKARVELNNMLQTLESQIITLPRSISLTQHAVLSENGFSILYQAQREHNVFAWAYDSASSIPLALSPNLNSSSASTSSSTTSSSVTSRPQFTRARVLLRSGHIIEVRIGDILSERVDVLVNPANNSLTNEGGLSAAIAARGGTAFTNACQASIKQFGNIPPGDVRESATTGDLSKICFLVLHAVGPVWNGGNRNERLLLQSAVQKALTLADTYHRSSIAIPAISAGIYGMPVHHCADDCIKAALEYLRNNPNSEIKEIRFVDFDDKVVGAFVQSLHDASSSTSQVTVPQAIKVRHQWHWWHEEGRWQMYDPDQNYQIEFAYLENRSTVVVTGDLNLVKNGNRYDIDFTKKTQRNTKTNFERKLTRTLAETGREDWQRQGVISIPAFVPGAGVASFKEFPDSAAAAAPANRPLSASSGSVSTSSSSGSPILLIRARSQNDAALVQSSIFAEINKQILVMVCPFGDDMSADRAEEIIAMFAERHIEAKFDAATKKFHLMGAKSHVNAAVADVALYVAKDQGIRYPTNWTAFEDEQLHLVGLSKGNDEWNRVFGKMQSTIPNLTIITLRRVQSPHLWQVFYAKKKLRERKGGQSATELELWHGTSKKDPLEILQCETGLDMRFSAVGMWGVGLYFAEKACYSHLGYSFQLPSGHRQLLLVRVLVGHSIQLASDPNLRMPPPRGVNAHGIKELYDSVCGVVKIQDNSNDTSAAYILYENDCAYPAYLVTYTV